MQGVIIRSQLPAQDLVEGVKERKTFNRKFKSGFTVSPCSIPTSQLISLPTIEASFGPFM